MVIRTEHEPTPAMPAAHQAKKKSALSRIGVPVLLILIGLAVLLYPVVATQWNNHKQQAAAQEYAKLEKKADPAVLQKSLEDAHRYNETRNTGPILDPWLARISVDNQAYQDYLAQLKDFDAMARIVVPDAHIDLPVYHGTDEKVLQRGVGHLFGSDLPVGGPGTHAILTGHTGLSTATLFDNLKDVKVKQPIYISVAGEKMKYEVDQIKTVLPEETGDLAPVEGQDLITLVTCTPYGINSHRLLVRAHRVPMDPAEASVFENSGFHLQWWMWAIMIAAAVILILLALWIRSMMRKARRAAEAEAAAAAPLMDGEDPEAYGEEYGESYGQEAGYGQPDGSEYGSGYGQQYGENDGPDYGQPYDENYGQHAADDSHGTGNPYGHNDPYGHSDGQGHHQRPDGER